MDQNSSSMSSSGGGSSESSGTRDSTYDVVSVLYHALKGADLCQKFLGDANSDPQLREFFQQAQQMQRQLADQAKQRLQSTMSGSEGGQGGGSSSGSAFSQFGSGGSSSSSMGSSSGQSGMSSDSMQRMGSNNDREGGSAYTSGQSVSAQGEDQSMSQFGQSPTGGGQRHDEMSTGGGGTSSF
ncbi:hypothetical protein M8312_07585 [Sphingomonas sp. KRR8]|uniref:hypothetical protein n=1 Tax=Sphingomonas sp. KRR8 TaxID=2942996 RepID=UPI002020AD90|nr:hypothetical protein [Sphingomonas sp. KRR8]URD59688.1 hypothetical protein M8312_07585 [Sphingomonas sp. KRR8]